MHCAVTQPRPCRDSDSAFWHGTATPAPTRASKPAYRQQAPATGRRLDEVAAGRASESSDACTRQPAAGFSATAPLRTWKLPRTASTADASRCPTFGSCACAFSHGHARWLSVAPTRVPALCEIHPIQVSPFGVDLDGVCQRAPARARVNRALLDGRDLRTQNVRVFRP